MFLKIKTIKILPDFLMEAKFINDVVKTYDFKSLFDKYSVFAPLKQSSFFEQVVVDCEVMESNGMTI